MYRCCNARSFYWTPSPNSLKRQVVECVQASLDMDIISILWGYPFWQLNEGRFLTCTCEGLKLTQRQCLGDAWSHVDVTSGHWGGTRYCGVTGVRDGSGVMTTEAVTVGVLTMVPHPHLKVTKTVPWKIENNVILKYIKIHSSVPFGVVSTMVQVWTAEKIQKNSGKNL